MQARSEPVLIVWYILCNAVDDIDTESVAALVDPEIDYVLHCLYNSRILPVEISLTHCECMQVILPPHFIVLPGTSSER